MIIPKVLWYLYNYYPSHEVNPHQWDDTDEFLSISKDFSASGLNICKLGLLTVPEDPSNEDYPDYVPESVQKKVTWAKFLFFSAYLNGFREANKFNVKEMEAFLCDGWLEQIVKVQKNYLSLIHH